MVTTFFSSPFLVQVLLPFVILFLVIYAILQKTKILSGDNKTLNVVISLALSIIAVSFAYPTDIITRIIPLFAVTIVIVLVLMIIFAFAEGKDKFELNNGIKYAIWGIAGFAILAMVIWASGIWTYLTNKTHSNLLWNIIFFIIIIAVIIVASIGGSSGGDKKK
ncbi:MAG: hypothetical protein AABW73_04025 [Nanoarchaeota archaeon]